MNYVNLDYPQPTNFDNYSDFACLYFQYTDLYQPLKFNHNLCISLAEFWILLSDDLRHREILIYSKYSTPPKNIPMNAYLFWIKSTSANRN